MGTRTPLANWLLDHCERLDLRATRLKWIDTWAPGYYDLFVAVNIDGTSCHGRGIGRSEDEAFTKAGAEALERYIFLRGTDFPNTNGIAVHSRKEDAIKAARLELLERDAFFCHHLTKTPFKSLSIEILKEASRLLPHVIEKIEALGIELAYGLMNGATQEPPVICCAFGQNASRPFGVRLGLGCKETLSDSVIHATFECIMGLAQLEKPNFRFKTLALEHFLRTKSPSVTDHDRLGLHPDSGEIMKTIFFSGTPSDKDPVEAAIECHPQFQYYEIPLPESLKGAPLIAIRASSPDLQSAFFGNASKNLVNMKRINQFQNGIGIENLNFSPHFLG